MQPTQPTALRASSHQTPPEWTALMHTLRTWTALALASFAVAVASIVGVDALLLPPVMTEEVSIVRWVVGVVAGTAVVGAVAYGALQLTLSYKAARRALEWHHAEAWVHGQIALWKVFALGALVVSASPFLGLGAVRMNVSWARVQHVRPPFVDVAFRPDTPQGHVPHGACDQLQASLAVPWTLASALPSSNPCNVWMWGTFAEGQFVEARPFTRDGLSGLGAVEGRYDHNPSVLFNDTTSSKLLAGRLIMDAGEIGLHPAPGAPLVLRFTVPQAGNYTVASKFKRKDNNGVAVSVRKNGQPLASGTTSPEPFTFAGTLALAAGDVVDFTLDVGSFGYNSNTTSAVLNIFRAGGPPDAVP